MTRMKEIGRMMIMWYNQARNCGYHSRVFLLV